jgi:hypothetical protein
MTTTRWRSRLTYIAMSACVVWHAAAMAIAPAPTDSALVRSFRALFRPYLTLFRLDNRWDFFAPDVVRGSQLRYFIEDAAGNRRDFIPDNEFGIFDPGLFWSLSWNYAIIDAPEIHAQTAATIFCRKHVALHPVSVTLLEYKEKEFTPKDYLAGKRPMDPEFVTVNTLKTLQCSGS